MDKVIFFLGGKNLEMDTIQGLLEQKNIEFVNKNLLWGDASIDQYLSQIKEKVNEEYVVYGIELANPENIVIDNLAYDNFQKLSYAKCFASNSDKI